MVQQETLRREPCAALVRAAAVRSESMSRYLGGKVESSATGVHLSACYSPLSHAVGCSASGAPVRLNDHSFRIVLGCQRVLRCRRARHPSLIVVRASPRGRGQRHHGRVANRACQPSSGHRVGDPACGRPRARSLSHMARSRCAGTHRRRQPQRRDDRSLITS